MASLNNLSIKILFTPFIFILQLKPGLNRRIKYTYWMYIKAHWALFCKILPNIYIARSWTSSCSLLLILEVRIVYMFPFCWNLLITSILRNLKAITSPYLFKRQVKPIFFLFPIKVVQTFSILLEVLYMTNIITLLNKLIPV